MQDAFYSLYNIFNLKSNFKYSLNIVKTASLKNSKKILDKKAELFNNIKLRLNYTYYFIFFISGDFDD